MATLKRRENGQPFNQTTIRIATDVYDNILQYARYGEEVPITLSLAIENLTKRGLESAKKGAKFPHENNFTLQGGLDNDQ